MKIETSRRLGWVALGLLFAVMAAATEKAPESLQVKVNWAKTVSTMKTTPTVMVVPSPILRKASPVRDAAFTALKEFNADHARYLAWYAYPRLAVPALDPPTREKTYWNFTEVDSVMVPFLEATRGKQPIVSFSTIPTWMFRTPQPVSYSSDPDTPDFAYGAQGTELLDPSGKQLGDYHARLVSWYTKGGFTDENGQYHRSGHHFDLPWWGVLNEPEGEHSTTPEQYTQRYDAIVSAVRKVNPKTKFMSLSLCGPPCGVGEGPRFFEYFLDEKNHRPGIPIDMISYHFYAHLREGSSVAEWQSTLFDKADSFILHVSYVEAIRKRLSPATQVNIDELGLRLFGQKDGEAAKVVPDVYWRIGAAYDSYLFLELAKRGIDVLTTSHFIGSDDFTPTESMINWRSGKPNIRYHARRLLNEELELGDRLVETKVTGPFTRLIQGILKLPDLPDRDTLKQKEVAIQAFETKEGRKILMINKTGTPVSIELTGAGRIAQLAVVDEKSGESRARMETVRGEHVRLGPFAVTVVTVR